jgi:uncharacterized protein YodC (DUF2158 family)
MKQSFQIGDVVQLKSGGVPMIVEGYDDKRPEFVTCVWQNKMNSYRESYHEQTLVKDDSPDKYTIITV